MMTVVRLFVLIALVAGPVFGQVAAIAPNENLVVDGIPSIPASVAEAVPLVIEVPPKLQGILDDFWQRPLCDVGFAGPDKGQGGKYLILPPDYKAEEPKGYFTFRSRTYGVFVFWRAFYRDPAKLEEPVKLMEQTRIYPLGKKESPRPMIFPDASAVPANKVYPTDSSYYDMLARFIQHEYVDPTELDMRGMLRSIGIIK